MTINHQQTYIQIKPSLSAFGPMKRALAIALVAVLALGVSPSISSAAIKAGATCKKEGQVSKKAGKEYTCIS